MSAPSTDDRSWINCTPLVTVVSECIHVNYVDIKTLCPYTDTDINLKQCVLYNNIHTHYHNDCCYIIRPPAPGAPLFKGGYDARYTDKKNNDCNTFWYFLHGMNNLKQNEQCTRWYRYSCQLNSTNNETGKDMCFFMNNVIFSLNHLLQCHGKNVQGGVTCHRSL